MLNLCLQSSEKQNLYPIAECLEPKFCLLKIGINCCKCRVAGRIGLPATHCAVPYRAFFCAIMVADVDLPVVGRDI